MWVCVFITGDSQPDVLTSGPYAWGHLDTTSDAQTFLFIIAWLQKVQIHEQIVKTAEFTIHVQNDHSQCTSCNICELNLYFALIH